MTNVGVPFVPESLRSLADGGFYQASERLAKMPLDRYVSSMPDTQVFSRYNDTPAIHAAVYNPADYNPSHAVFSLNPFGNGHQPHMDIRNRAVQAIAAPNSRLVSFPNNTATTTYYKLSPKALEAVASGDATPIAESIHATAEEMKLETIDLITYSQGTLVGVALLKLAQKRGVIKINNTLIADPTNVIERTPGQLKRDFTSGGLGALLALVKAVRDSGIPALEEAQAMRGPRDGLRLMRGLLGTQKGSKVPENTALHSAMTHDNLAVNIVETAAAAGGSLETNLTLARAEKSKITPRTESYEFIEAFMARNSTVISGYGHEAADNVTGVYALLAKLAIGQDKGA